MDETRVKVYVGEEEKTDAVGRGAICIVFFENEDGDSDGVVRAQSIVNGAIGVKDIVSHLQSMKNCFKTEDGGNMLDEAVMYFMMGEVLAKAGGKNGD